jgi:hypothetical protein
MWVLMLAVSASISPASAALSQPTGESPPLGGDVPAVNSWALAPSGTTPGQPENPGSRPNLSYELAPGATIDDSVSLFNYGNVQLTFAVYATDAFNDPSGAFDLLPGDKPPHDVGAWVTLPQGHLTVPANSRIDLPITVRVPADALPGDHAGAILAASQVEGIDSGGRRVTVDRRAGSRIYLRVAGPLNPLLTVDRVHSTYHGAVNPLDGSLDVTYTIRNAGNVRLAARQRLELQAPFGIQVDELVPKDVPELLPGNSLTLRAHFSGVPATVRATAKVSVTPVLPAPPPGAEPAVKVAAATRSGATWAVPWLVIALLCSAWLLSRLYLRYRRRREERVAGRQAPPPSGGPAPDLVAVP